MAHRFKNTTGSDLQHSRSGIRLPAGVYVDVSDGIDLFLLFDSQLQGWLTGGSVLYNDGTADIAAALAISHLTFTGHAKWAGFDNSANGFDATKVQPAIEEAKATAVAARYCVACGFDGNASSGRWLEFITNVASNVTPMVIPRASILKEISFAVSATSTITATVFKNGVALQTVTISAAKKATVTGLSHSIAALDEISVQVASGSGSRPMLFLFMQVF